MLKVPYLLKSLLYLNLALYFSLANISYGVLKINEFLAANDTINEDPQGDYDDWIEIFNTGNSSIDLSGMYLTDDLTEPDKWQFPQGITINAGEFLLVWADKDTEDNPSGLHASIKLSAGGEEIGLYDTDGLTLLDSIVFGDQVDDISYGRYPDGSDNWYPMNPPSPLSENNAAMSEPVYFSHLGGTISENFILKLSTPSNVGTIIYTTDGTAPGFGSISNSFNSTLIDLLAPCTVKIPTSSNDSVGWKSISYDDSAWSSGSTGVGYEGASDNNYGPLINLDISSMRFQNASAYIRVPFTLNNLDAIEELTLNMKYDDAFIAYINGNEVARSEHAPSNASWNSEAQSYYDDSLAVNYDSFEINNDISSLQSGENVLAIHLFNAGSGSSDILCVPQLIASGTQVVDYNTPSANSFTYNSATGISISKNSSTIIRARTVQPNFAPGPIQTHAYLAMSTELASFQSNLPIVVIDTFNETLEQVINMWPNAMLNPDPIPTYSSFFKPKDSTQIAKTTDIPDFSGRTGMNMRGQSSSELPKKPWKLETWDENGEDIDVPLLGLSADSDWVFHNPYTDRTFMRTLLAMEFSNTMGYYSPDTQFVELFVNENGGQIGGPSSDDYRGVYVLLEKIKRGDGRVEIEKLSPSDSTAPDITGGYIIRHDKNRLEDEFQTSMAGRWFYVEPSHDEITDAQKNYIKGYLDSFEGVLQSSNFGDPTSGYNQYIDVDSFIVNDFVSEITKEADTYIYSTYVTKDRNKKLQMSPQWDFNISMGNNDYRSFGIPTQHHTSGWNRDENTNMWEYSWHNRLLEDPEYAKQYADKWFHLRETVLSDESIANSINSKRSLIDQGAADRNFSRWNILNNYAGFGWAWPGSNFYYGGNSELPNNQSTHTYAMQVEWMKNWLTGTGIPSNSQDAQNYGIEFSDRLGWIDVNMKNRTGFGVPPQIYLNGNISNKGEVISGSNTVTLAHRTIVHNEGRITGNSDTSTGTIYYTLDGTDPREPTTGNISGIQYTGGSITVNDTTDLMVRSKSGNSWSALNRAIFADEGVRDNIRITEVMYNPDTSESEYIELKNIGNQSINLYLCKFDEGIEFTFPNLILNPGESTIVVEDISDFEDGYLQTGLTYNIAGEFENQTSLSNGGERIVLKDAFGREIHNFEYDDFYPITDGYGFSICINDFNSLNLATWDDPSNWSPSTSYKGSPCEDSNSSMAEPGSIVINEILAHQDVATGDWVELHNTTSSPISIGGWFLSDDIEELKKYQIANGTIIPANGFITFTQNSNFGDNANDSGIISSFGLSEHGETLYLSSGIQGNLAGGYSIFQPFGATINGTTLGRHAGANPFNPLVDFVRLESPTFNGPNTAVYTPDVVVSEIRYNAVDEIDSLNEYIELVNRSSETVYLYDTANPSNTWKLGNGIEYTFPEGVSIPSGGSLLVTRTDPEIFKYINNIPYTEAVYGPYSKALDNDNDIIEILIPGSPEIGFVPYALNERINYSDGNSNSGLLQDPWPIQPDTIPSYSLQRDSYENYGNNPFNWSGSSSTPISQPLQLLEIRKVGNQVEIHWIGSGLKSTNDLSQPWSDVINITSPHTVDIINTPSQFFKF